MNEQSLSYTSSLPFDRRLYPHDIQGSIAHAQMLRKQGIISEEEGKGIVAGLLEIKEELDIGEFPFHPELEDIHMNIEARLIQKIGAIGGKLHTARSRNDQVSLDLRLFLKEETQEVIAKVRELRKAIVGKAEENKQVILPGYTHLQRAQPVLLAHHFLAYFEMLSRDEERFKDSLKRMDVLPLGSGALAGVPYPIDREFVARSLGFSCLSQNSLDAVSDRDFVIEFEACSSLLMMHLSRLCEELILWSSSEFGFVEVSSSFGGGSSIMPQKRNPDVAELCRGKVGRIYGNLMGMLTVMKSLPLSYNKDMQEDKEGLFDTVDTVLGSLSIMSGVVQELKVRKERMEEASQDDLLLATDLADFLVRRGIPFREAHEIVGKIVKFAQKGKRKLRELSLEEYRSFSDLFDEEVKSLTPSISISLRDEVGGTSPGQVEHQLKRARKLLK
jgi:argininosuccinate lyase